VAQDRSHLTPIGDRGDHPTASAALAVQHVGIEDTSNQLRPAQTTVVRGPSVGREVLAGTLSEAPRGMISGRHEDAGVRTP
jgi:hypothetical protein